MLNKLKHDIDLEIKTLISKEGRDFEHNKESRLLYSGIKDFIGRSGKRIRPILFLISYLGYAGRKNYSYRDLLKSSLSVELLHDFLLVHDDVIDKSDLRRGKPTMHRFFNSKLGLAAGNEIGPNLSIVAGDIIFAMAIEALQAFDEDTRRKEKALSLLTKAAKSTGIGEFLDVINDIQSIEKITEKNVLLTYTLKTAKYTFEAPLQIGAALAGAADKEAEKLSRMAVALGGAFQIQDDLLDVFSSSKKTGKPVLSDLNESKKTLLVWKTYENLQAKDKRALKSLLNKKKKTYNDLIRIKKFIMSSGSHSYCLEVVKLLRDEALMACEQLKIKKRYKNILLKFIKDLGK